MEIKSLNKKSKVICIICVVAILLALCCQYIPGWKYSGVKKDSLTGEKRAIEMEASISNLVWKPFTEESKALIEYIKDPSLKYSEEISVESIDEEQFRGIQVVFDPSLAVVEEEPEVTEATEDTKATEDTEITEAEEVETTYNEDMNYSCVIIGILEDHVDLLSNSVNSKNRIAIAEATDKKSALTTYEKYIKANAKGNKIEQTEFFNGIVLFPALLFVVELLAIALTILFMRKGKGVMFAAVSTFVIGVANLFYIYSQPIFLSMNADSFNLLSLIFSIITYIGFILVMANIKLDIIAGIKPSAAKILLTGLVLTIIKLITSFLPVGSSYQQFKPTEISNLIALAIFVIGILSALKSIIANANDKKLEKKHSMK